MFPFGKGSYTAPAMRCAVLTFFLSALLAASSFGQANTTGLPARELERLERDVRRDSREALELQERYNQARKAALDMVQIAGHLKDIVLPDVSTGVGSGSLRNEVKRQCREIRDLTKLIREVSFLDPSEQDKASSYDKAKRSDMPG